MSNVEKTNEKSQKYLFLNFFSFKYHSRNNLKTIIENNIVKFMKKIILKIKLKLNFFNNLKAFE